MDTEGNVRFPDQMSYARAPITEAVIELRYARPQPKETVEKCAKALEKTYFYNELEQAVSFTLDPNAGRAVTTGVPEWEGRKLSSIDRADVVMFRTTALICSRLAPYMGWDEFLPRAKHAWDVLKKHTTSVEIGRIGVRYVNRIDIPVVDSETVDVESYLAFHPQTPPQFRLAMNSFLVQSERPLGVDNCKVMMLSATVPSPLVSTLSLGLDIDVFRDTDIPRRDDELWALVNRMRAHKNFVFENCITDRARDLFS
jgi:uncharacterized protein (TIGR04255 family)